MVISTQKSSSKEHFIWQMLWQSYSESQLAGYTSPGLWDAAPCAPKNTGIIPRNSQIFLVEVKQMKKIYRTVVQTKY